MNTQLEEKTFGTEQRTRYYPLCWCITEPANQFGNYLWGAILVAAGGLWLLQNLGLLSGALLDVLWPLLLVGVGLSILGWAFTGRSRETP